VGNESAIIAQVTMGRNAWKKGSGRNGNGERRGVYGRRNCNQHDLYDATGSGECPITTGCPLANLSSRTIDCCVVPIVVASTWNLMSICFIDHLVRVCTITMHYND
jgi:hypothetical protein